MYRTYKEAASGVVLLFLNHEDTGRADEIVFLKELFAGHRGIARSEGMRPYTDAGHDCDNRERAVRLCHPSPPSCSRMRSPG